MSTRSTFAPPRERGGLRITDRALSRIATRAAAGSAASGAVTSRGRVRRHRAGADAALRLVLRYPGPLAREAGQAVRAAERAADAQAGVRLRRTRVRVVSLEPQDGAPGLPPGPVASAGHPTAPARARRAAHRWTARRIPAAVLSTVGLLAATAWWSARVRGVPHPAAVQRVLDQLASARVGGLPVLAAAVAAGILGLWLVLLAVTGRRPSGWRLPAARGTAVVEVDRRLVEREVRQAVGAPGRFRVRAARTVRITVRAPVPADTVRAAARDAYARLGFDGPPRTVVRVPRPTGPAARTGTRDQSTEE
ncbi:hypothetical protein ACWCYY_40310 [Kitasatospora sp. NPDC001664]